MDYFAATTATYTSSTTNHPDKLKKKKKNSNNNKGLTTTTNNGAHYCCKLSTDPQSVAARERRHRISNRFKTLQSLVPGGSKMDTVSMLEQAINYVKFLKSQILIHQTLVNHTNTNTHTHAQLGLDQYRNQGGLLHYNHDPAPAASFYFTGHPTTFDSGSPDLGGTSADSYCSHPGACSAQPAGGSQLMFPAPEYFVGHGGEDGMRYL